MAKFGSIYIKSLTNGVSFDRATTIEAETHTMTNDVVSQTLEDGTPLADHIIVQQDELEVIAFVSNSVPQKSQEVFKSLKMIRNLRQLCIIFTDHEIYHGMAIESISAPHSAPMVNEIRFTIKFKRVDYVSSIVNVFPVSDFQSFENVEFGEGIAQEQTVNEQDEKMQQARDGDLNKTQDISQGACSNIEAGELTPQQAA